MGQYCFAFTPCKMVWSYKQLALNFLSEQWSFCWRWHFNGLEAPDSVPMCCVLSSVGSAKFKGGKAKNIKTLICTEGEEYMQVLNRGRLTASLFTLGMKCLACYKIAFNISFWLLNCIQVLLGGGGPAFKIFDFAIFLASNVFNSNLKNCRTLRGVPM